MAIARTIEALTQMEADGIIGRYAIAGAVAAYNYIEPTLTEDLDVLVSFESAATKQVSGLVTLEPIFSYLKARGYDRHAREGLLIEGWLVQFLPVANDLDAEALQEAASIDLRASGIGSTGMTRVLRPEHLVAIALRLGRPKDLVRIAQFFEESAVDVARLRGVIERHGLMPAWHEYRRKVGISDPGGIG